MSDNRAGTRTAVEHLIALGHRRIGFDDIPFGDPIEPAITVVAQDPRGIGLRAARLLFDRLDGFAGPSRRVVVPTRILHRGSREIPGPARTAGAGRSAQGIPPIRNAT